MRIKKIGLMVLATISLMAFTACGSSKSDKKEVTIGYFNNITHAQALLMKAEGSLEDKYGEEAEVKWQSFNAGPAEVEALFSGDIDIGYIGPVPAITANVKSNSDVVVLSGSTKGGAVLLQRSGAGISSVKDLAGKTVAIPQLGNTQHLSLLHLLSENGLKPDTAGGDVKVTAVANADVENMMDRGDIDAALVPEPWGATLLGKGAELVLDYKDVFMDGDYNVAVVVVRKDFLKENPELVEKFVEEHEAATEKINNDNDATVKKINDEINAATGKSLSEDVLKEAFGRIGVSTELNKESLEEFANISKEEGFIDQIPDSANLYK